MILKTQNFQSNLEIFTKIWKNWILSALVFLDVKIKKNIQSMYQKNVVKLLIGEKGKRHYVLIKDFNAFMYDHTLHRGRKHFCCYCLQSFSTEEILKHHIKDCFKINDK